MGNSDTIFKYFSLEIRKRLSIRLKNDNQKSLEMAWHRYLTLLFVMLIKSHWTQGLSKVQLSNKTFYKSCWYHDNFAHCSTSRKFWIYENCSFVSLTLGSWYEKSFSQDWYQKTHFDISVTYCTVVQNALKWISMSVHADAMRSLTLLQK